MTFEKIYMEVFSETEQVSEPGASNISIQKVSSPTYELYRKWHDDVGRPWNWHLRPRINDRSAICKLLEHPLTEMGIFEKDGTEVGYYLFVGDNSEDLELSDFGFAPNYLNMGFGSVILPKLLKMFFDRGVRRIWLSTRSTNDPRVPKFYEKFGFREYNRETVAG